ncbi:MAG TPA: ATP-dependent 6-phosphofructokinase, partial [Stellaceae bacterium]|nr:ATP-dependent 6-phosphofructokinase [Stellaceae bacterium]
MRLGIMTSGGDCPGLNAAIRAVVRRAGLTYGWTVIGIRRGAHGLMDRPVDADTLDARSLGAATLRQGGTLLETVSTGDPFAYPMGDGRVVDRSAEAVAGLHKLEIGALICIGGDGSLRIIRRLALAADLPLLYVPKTIDNDVPLAGRCIGHDTAVATATDAVDRLHDVAASQRRVMVLEVMGRDAGHIALAAGIAGGADAILVPEIPFALERVTLPVDWAGGMVVVAAEGVRDSDGQRLGAAGIADALGRLAGRDSRGMVLGHLQRGGSPVATDRIIASALGTAVVDLVAAGRRDCMVAWTGEHVVDLPLSTVP